MVNPGNDNSFTNQELNWLSTEWKLVIRYFLHLTSYCQAICKYLCKYAHFFLYYFTKMAVIISENVM